MPASASVLLVGAPEPFGGLPAALSAAAFDVVVELEPLRACTLLREHHFDAVVASLPRPGTDALALLRAARRHAPPAVTVLHFAHGGQDSAVLDTVRRAPETVVVSSVDAAVIVEALRGLLRGETLATAPDAVEADGPVRGLIASIEVAGKARSHADLEALRAQLPAAARSVAGGRAAWLVDWDGGEHVQKVGEASAPPGLAAEVRLARRPLVRHGRRDAPSFLGVPVAVNDAVTAALLIEFESGVDASGGLPFAESLTRLAAMSEASVRLHQRVDGSPEVLAATLWTALALRGLDVRGHARRVADVAEALAKSPAFAISPADAVEIRQAALLHDVGKLGLPDPLLRGAPLTDAERIAVQRHPLLAQRILSDWADLEGAARLVRSSRERWDGGGFPDGLAADAIPMGSRLLAVSDAWDGLMFGADGRTGRSLTRALEELRRHAGRALDPQVVGVMEALVWERTLPGVVDSPVEESAEGRAVA